MPSLAGDVVLEGFELFAWLEAWEEDAVREVACLEVADFVGRGFQASAEADLGDLGAGNSGADRICLMGHKDSMVLVEQMGIRSQTQYKQDYLATLFTSDTLYGVKAMRTAATTGAALSSSAFALAVPA